MNFRQEKPKLQKIDRSSKNQISDLINKENDIVDFSNINFDIKTPEIIFDTDWIDAEITLKPVDTEQKGEDVWCQATIEFREDVRIQEEFLPFLDFNVIIEDPTEGEVVTFISSPVPIIRDKVIVEGDGQTLYVGFPETSSSLIILPEETFTENGIPLNHGSTAWFHNLTYTPSGGGSDQSITQPIIEIRAEVDLGTGCNGADKDFYSIFVGIGGDPQHTITNIDGSGFSGIGKKTEFRNTVVDEICTTNSTDFNDISISLSFSSVDRYQIFYRDGSTLTFKDFGNAVTVVDQDFVFSGYFIYYSENFNAPILFDLSGSGNYVLEGIGSTSDTTYNTITLKTETDNLITGSSDSFNNNINAPTRLSYFKYPTEEDLYNINFQSRVNFLLPANKRKEIDTNLKTYSKASPTSYSLSSDEDSEEFSEDLYTVESDFRYKIKAFIKNPYIWKENRKYDL